MCSITTRLPNSHANSYRCDLLWRGRTNHRTNHRTAALPDLNNTMFFLCF